MTSLLSVAGVVFFVGGLEVVGGEADVLLGADQMPVAEDGLHMPHPGLVPDHVRGAAMPEGVRAHGDGQLGLPGIFGDHAVQHAAAHALSAQAEEQRAGVGIGRVAQQFGPDGVEIAFQEAPGHLAQRHDTILCPLPLPDHQEAGVQVEVFEIEGDQLRPADGGGVEGFHDATIPEADHRAGVRLAQELPHVLDAEHRTGHAIGYARVFEIRRRVVGQVAVASQPAEEARDCGQMLVADHHAVGPSVFAEDRGYMLLIVGDVPGQHFGGMPDIAAGGPPEEAEIAGAMGGDGLGPPVEGVEIGRVAFQQFFGGHFRL